MTLFRYSSNFEVTENLSWETSIGSRSWTITAWTDKRQRDTMEDAFIVEKIQRNGKEAVLLAVFDGHGGEHAASYCKEVLIPNICEKIHAWEDEVVFGALKNAFIETNFEMKKTEYPKWPKKSNGQSSSSGTTCTILLILIDTMYIANVGDSCAFLLSKKDEFSLVAENISRIHNPWDPNERKRIERCGGKTVLSLGVPRVVCFRTEEGGREIEFPCLDVTRSLGDFWSITHKGQYSISPEPFLAKKKITSNICGFIVSTDGVCKILDKDEFAEGVQEAISENENPAKHLIEFVKRKKPYLGDNATVIVAFLK